MFILETTETNVSPRKFCAKTVNPAKFSRAGRDVRALFEREMRLWLSIPFHYNALTALGLDLPPPPKELESQFDTLPLVRMPFCDGSLTAWVKDQASVTTADRLIALAQSCSGLQWLYEHGLQGHGDLKPDNILFKDLREAFVLPETGFPSRAHPWQIRVADLGWADIWCQGGGTYHAWRPYLAPERFRNSVVPQASDIFALGVIACELLSGMHTAGGKTESLGKKWTQKKWEAWAASMDRVINVEPHQVGEVISRCLSPDPSKRPGLNELKAVLCDALEARYGLQVARQLQVQDEHARTLAPSSHKPWAAEQLSRVSAAQLDCSIAQLESTFANVGHTSSTDEIARWLATSRSLQRLLFRRAQPDDLRRVGVLAAAMLDLVLERFKVLDLREEIYGKPVIADLKPGEVLWEFAAEAFNYLARGTGVDQALLESYRECLSRLYGEAQREALEAFSSEVLGKDSAG